MPQPERVSILDPAVAGVEELQFDRGRSDVTKRRRDPCCLHIEVPLGIARQRAEQVGSEQRSHSGPVASTRLAGDSPVLSGDHGAEVGVDRWHRRVAEIAVIPAGASEIQGLASAQTGPAVDDTSRQGGVS